MKRLRVLISSHEFSPYQGSECAVGWNIATRIAVYHDVTVLCADGPAGHQGAYREAVTDYFITHGEIPGLRVVFVEQPPKTSLIAEMNRHMMKVTGGIGWQVLYYLGLNVWHRSVFNIAKRMGFSSFDVVHQLTPISFRRPGFLSASRRPFFWGPVGGMCNVPIAFTRLGGLKSHLFERLRSLNIKKEIQSTRFRSLVHSAACIWAITDEELRVINAICPRKAKPMIDTAPPPGVRRRIRIFQGDRPLRLCWSGRHEHIKALPLLLHAIAQLPDPRKVHVTVLGDGPETAKWQTIAGTLCLKNISWMGQLPYQDALQIMEQHDVLAHTSYREATSMVILEALGMGMPVICHDAYGMAVAINESCGIKVPFENPGRSVTGFRDAILTLLNEPYLIHQLSKGALQRSLELSWDAKAKEIADAYVTQVVTPEPVAK